ncbi:MBL fold metallo-hydrolase [Nocardioides sp. zg-ZUI104]|uniref:MBL fold metallo-hydrolase n=1 Tax=Nocardioides faecalis TaxID=2803858 RepID=UPI001BCDE097|nr:MBL fold metallo-hydrolase [Nocardioides faecalis]MBS4751235.1 MBL fold metallo-hydrolase [Nocardioides faecalis]
MPFTEIADRVWVLRHPWLDLNLTVVAGERGFVLVDTHGSQAAAREVLDEVARLSSGPLVAVVNTHEHFDHTLGNATVLDTLGTVPVHATEEAAARTPQAAQRAKDAYAATPQDPRAAQVLATEVRPADRTFSSAAFVDLGDRLLELVHPGRGHTAGDLVARVPDVDVLLAGDLVEESAPPALGDDSWPMEWPTTLDLVLGLLTPASVVVPGHGSVVDRRFVEEQCDDLRAVAETIRELAQRGVPVTEALAAASWPYPAEALEDAVRRGYAHLPPLRRQLPLA